MTDREAMQMALEALNLPSMKTMQMLQQRDAAIATLRAQLEQPEQDPVAWMAHKSKMLPTFHRTFVAAQGWADNPTPLYTAPPQRKPLTNEEIEQAQREVWRSLPSDFDYTTSSWIELGIRYAEAAHDIKETP